MKPRPPFGSAGLLLVATVGCVGTVGERAPQPGQTPRAPGEPGPDPHPTPAQPTTPAAPGTCGSPMVSTLLTREQYVNTVSDLLGIDVRPWVTFSDASGRKYRPDVRRSALEAEGMMRTARAIADQAVTASTLPMLLPCDPATGESKCADQFIDRFGARATRRPLTAELRADLRQLYDAGQAAAGFVAGIKWVVEGLLQAPELLYQVLPAVKGKPGDVMPLGDFEIAERLAYFLWNSGPDELLWEAASKGQLRTAAQLAAQVSRMRTDAKAARAREDFYGNWMSLDLVGSLTRDDPAYTPELARSLARSALAGIDNVHQTEGTSDALFGSSTVFVDPMLARLYGGKPPAGSDLEPQAFDKTQRRGILTHPALMAIIAEHDTSDPIHRGTFVYTKVLCQSVPEPADGVPALPSLGPNLTTRQRLVQHRAAPTCASCHALFDPIGLAFENFDSLGRYRATEHGTKIDSSGEITQSDIDVTGPFADGFALLDRLSRSRTVRGCLAQQWYEYASRRDLDRGDTCAIDGIKAGFMADGKLNDLLSSIALAEGFRNRLLALE